ncbi:hypothetical protein [Catellatospora paridis]|uniref:hypothetical protein n=1 Tax=Catellatospora paridis TaxID=1617086 RepID=UPI0012D44101|nr:hypothetical protein [Catellatospora paridis]
MKKSQQLLERGQAVVELYEALESMLDRMEDEVDSVAARIGYIDDRHRWEVSEIERATSRLSGRALAAAGEYDQTIEIHMPFDGGTYEIQAIRDWRHCVEFPERLSPKVVLAALQQIIGRFEGDAERMRRQEKTLAGRIARFVAFPSEVRSIAGQTSAAVGQAGFIVTIAAQVVGTLLLFGLGGWLGISLI